MSIKSDNQSLRHLAIIMDGNARWAKTKHLPKAEGHRKGSEVVRGILPTIIQHNISYLTLYAFSFENLGRSKHEISFLINLFDIYLRDEIDALHKDGIRLKVIGHLDYLHKKTKQRVIDAVELTKDNTKLTLCLAFAYGSKMEIVDACQKIIDTKITRISLESFKRYLYDPEMPDVDLMIRTGNAFRISNFLLWQAAYAELFFTEKYWPDFGSEDLIAALDEYKKRKRTFGKR